MRRRRAFLCALAALAVPLHAFATTDGDPAPGPLEVQASLDECGLLQNQIVCKIDASWSTVENATSYQASVTRPDGSVVDEGEVADGSTSFWVPYAGDGTYSIQISAYGEVDADPAPDVVAKARASTDAAERAPRGGVPEAKLRRARHSDATKPDRRGDVHGDRRDPQSACDEAAADPAVTPTDAAVETTTTTAVPDPATATVPDAATTDCPPADPAADQPAAAPDAAVAPATP